MRRRHLALTLLAAGLAGRGAWASAELGGLTLRGQARFRFFGLHVYDIRLWSGAAIGPDNWTEHPLTLEIEYARGLKGVEIARRSLQEMRRQGEIDETQASQWLAEMTAAFPDVKAGDRLSGSFEPGVGARFFLNGQLRRRIADARFARLFFGIWLSPQTSEPSLREQLLGRHGSG